MIRPGDANEVVEAWRVIMQLQHEPAVLVLTRQDLPTLDRTKYAPAAGLAQGAYVLADAAGRQARRHPARAPAARSRSASAPTRSSQPEGIKARVVSMPSWELFDDQDPAYRDHVLPPDVKARVSVEQASTFGWTKYVGDHGTIIGMRTFGASAPLKELLKEFGFTVDRVAEAAREQLKKGPR